MANLQDITNRSEVGAIKPWTKATAPAGYLLCDGAAVSRTTYAELFAIDRAIKIIFDKNLTNKQINLYTDSKYSIDCISKWYKGWVKNNKLDRPNIEIIQSIFEHYHKYFE